MSNFDITQQCPCGLGKKIKFCCKDIVHDLEKIQKASEGKQYGAALGLIEKSLEKHPDRQSLWALKLTILLQTDKLDEAREANKEFLRLAPKNPIALANAAVLTILELDDIDSEDADVVEQHRNQLLYQAVAKIHLSMENCSEQVPFQCFEALGIVGQLLIESGHLQSGREHLWFQYAVGGQVPSRGSQMLLELGRSSEVPLLLKQETKLPTAIDWVQWKEAYLEARDLAMRGGWTQAAEKVEQLIAEHEAHPVLLRAHAALRCRLPDAAKSVQALRAVAEHKDIPEDEAVEAEALAQILDPVDNAEQVDLIRLSYVVADVDRVLERLLADRRAQVMPIDFGALGSEEGPPPKSGFTLLDKEMPSASDGLAVDAVPTSLGELLVFGKETDRDARLETIVSQFRLAELDGVIRDIAGDALTADPTEEVLGQTALINEQMTLRPQFPKNTPLEFRNQYVRDREKHLLLDQWTKLPNPALDGKAPEEVASDPEYRRRLLATILMMETTRRTPGSRDHFKQLRDQLNLPQPELIKVKSGEARVLHLARLSQVDVSSLSDDDLITLFVRASQNGVMDAVMVFGEALVSRDSLRDSIKPAEIFARMAQAASDTAQTIELLQRAQQSATDEGDSPGVYLVSEFATRMLRGEGVEAQSLLNRIQLNHVNEPAVAQMLMQTLQQFGLVGPDGQPTMAPAQAAMAGAGSSPAPQPTGGATESGLWTPDGGSAASSGSSDSGEKSKLWVPGMD